MQHRETVVLLWNQSESYGHAIKIRKLLLSEKQPNPVLFRNVYAYMQFSLIMESIKKHILRDATLPLRLFQQKSIANVVCIGGKGTGRCDGFVKWILRDPLWTVEV